MTYDTCKKNRNYWGWRDGKVIKSTACFSRGHGSISIIHTAAYDFNCSSRMFKGTTYAHVVQIYMMWDSPLYTIG